ncbi:PAS domain-containing protein [Paenibacillaceae bacterium]|nr:PAS domain-containing protein [Paenibacillaceae bacterium]
MWKETLLQVMIALVPVFAFQMWFDRSYRLKGTPYFMGILCTVSMMTCMLVSTDLFEVLELDFRAIPYIIGSLYGGIPVAAFLSVIYVYGLHSTLHDFWGQLGFVLYLIVFVPALLVSIRSFQRADRKKKQRISGGLALLLLGTFGTTLLDDLMNHDFAWDMRLLWFSFVVVVVYVVVVWSVVLIMESVKEKQQLHSQLHKMSMNYRNEVQKLQRFIDITPVAVIIVDDHGIITHLNEMAMRMFGEKIPENKRLDMIGKLYTNLYESAANEATGRLIHLALNGADATAEIVQEGNINYIKTGFSVRDMHNNTIIGAALIAHDITEITRLRDEVGRMERLSLVGQMAASITHEIRNPMAVIRGFVQLMQERSPDHQRDYFKIIMDELDRANGIISDFLSLAQNRIVQKERRSLNDIINELMPLLWADANLRGQSIELDLCEPFPLLDVNDKEIKQLILNLARNGMEAMEEKGLLRLSTVRTEHTVELQVSDMGCGISEDKLEHLFEPFYTTKTRGTGLGLPLCLSIVEHHGGKIEVSSKEGVGTTFTVSFDVHEMSEEKEEVADA